MQVAAGSRLGPYEIISLIGAGGMGEVYKARDTRLSRIVAVKILPSSFAIDPDRLRRFEQEARAVAALSHPNILAVYDIGQHEGTPYLVSELLEGESLREMLARGPLSHRKAVNYSIQVAKGLAAAHDKSIAHRDLKPDNIYITREGQVKILDFGLSKNVAAHGAAIAAAMTTTGTTTEVGMVMGTAGYMSPEQVRGEGVDCRTDIFSFGSVLFEMLTGKRAFKRGTVAETMTAVLHDEPPIFAETDHRIPPALDRTLRHCLEKAPELRFQSARDLAYDLESLTSLTPSGGLPAASSKGSPWWRYIAAGFLLVLISALAGWKISSVIHPAEGSRFHQLTYRRGFLSNSRFTPDGQSVLYTASWDGALPAIFIMPVDGVSGRPFGINNARLESISTNGEVAVVLAPHTVTLLINPGTLARASNSTSAPKPEIENVQGADFRPGTSELAVVRYLPARFLCQVEFPVGNVLYKEAAVDNLRFSPDGRYLAFVTHPEATDDRGSIVILRVGSGEKIAESPVYESAMGLAWTPSGKEVWLSSPLESGVIRSLSLSGKSREPFAVPGRVHLRDISASGQLLLEQGLVRRGIIVSTDRGEFSLDISWLDFNFLRAISDDGKTVLFEQEGASQPGYTVFVRNIDGSPATALGEGYGLALSKDKQWALGERLGSANREIWLYPVGPGEARRISPPNLFPSIAASFLSDGKRVVYLASEAGHRPRAWLQELNGGDPHPITEEGSVGWRVSADDKWLLASSLDPSGAHSASLVPLNGGKPVPAAGFQSGDNFLGWAEGNEVYVATEPAAGRSTARIDKLDPWTGKRTFLRDVPISPVNGLRDRVNGFKITPDGATVAFDYTLELTDLYTMSGVR
jgi:eukaryotic-like serine/threonine-protein kinase